MENNFWKEKKVFITGITGFLGSWLAVELLKRRAQVTGLVRDQVPESNFNLSGVAKRVSIVHGSLTDFDVVSRALLEYEIEYCFHLAAQAIVGAANQNPLPTFESNIRGTWTILEAARRTSGIRGVIVASSDKAYGTQAVPYREDAPLLGEHPYDVSKACAEQIARTYAKSFGLAVGVTRCSNLYGGGDLNFSRIIPGTIRSLLLDESPIIRSDGSPVRDYIYVGDVVNGYLGLGERVEEEGIRGQAFNLGTSEPISVLDLTNRLIAISGKGHLQPMILGRGKMPGEIDRQYLSISKAKGLLGWSPSVSLDGGLRETYSWYKQFFQSHKSFVVNGVNEGA